MIPYLLTRRRSPSRSSRSFAWFPIAVVTGVLGATRLPAQFAGSRGQPINGVACDAQEGQRIHIHQHLTILDHGTPITIPPDVGRPASARCLYWLHTHTPDGIIHIEAPIDRSFTLANFFAIWEEPLDRTHAASATLRRGEAMRVWVDGKRYLRSPATIPLGDHTDIVIEVGPPFRTPQPFTAWNGAQ